MVLSTRVSPVQALAESLDRRALQPSTSINCFDNPANPHYLLFRLETVVVIIPIMPSIRGESVPCT